MVYVTKRKVASSWEVHQVLHVPLPDLEARAEIFALHSKSIPLASDVNMKTLASLTEGCSSKSIIGNNV